MSDSGTGLALGGGTRHESSHRRNGGQRQSSPIGMSASRSVAIEIRNRSAQLMEIRQSQRRPSEPHLIIRTVPPIMTAAKNTQTTWKVVALASAAARPTVTNAAITLQTARFSTSELRIARTL